MPLCIWVEDVAVRHGDLRWRACVGVCWRKQLSHGGGISRPPDREFQACSK